MPFLKKLRSLRQNRDIPPPSRTLHDHSTAAAILAVSKPILTFGPPQPPQSPSSPESTVISTIYRNTSDAAQTFLPPVQAVADVIPGVSGIIKGAIGGILSTLQLIDVIPHHSRAPLLILTPPHHRDTRRTRKTWRRSLSDCTCFTTILTMHRSLGPPLKTL
ncbi:hypothetical protein OG21DRAFT_270479 [Imleria badia]|nr:hypothetical protein OG21DRAFT_270479 [Imleria badia]